MLKVPTMPIGKVLIATSNLAYSVGAFLADFNETHVYNPRWPPHARFHNGQTMSLGIMLCIASLYYLLRKNPSPAAALDSLRISAITGSLYCLAGLTAIWYPGASWTDPEFVKGRVQLWLFAGILISLWIGYWLESLTIKKGKQT